MINWLKLPGPFGFPRYGWIAGIGAMLVAGYIFYKNRSQGAQSPTVDPNASLAGGSMMPTTYPYPMSDGSGTGTLPPPAPIPPTNYPSPAQGTVGSSSTQVPSSTQGAGNLQSGNLIVTPTQQQTGQKPTVLSNSAIMPIQQQRAIQAGTAQDLTRAIPGYNYTPPPGAVGGTPPRQFSPTSIPGKPATGRFF